MSPSIAWIDGHWGTTATLSLPLDDRALLLADGLFETVLIRNGEPQLLDEHLQRWNASAALLGMDPPRHRDMREVVKNVFTPGMVRSLEPVIRSHANQIMDTVLDMGEFDAVEDFGAQLSVHLICQLIGVPEDEKPLIREWTREASELGFDLLWHEQTNPDYERRIATSMQTMHDYFADRCGAGA